MKTVVLDHPVIRSVEQFYELIEKVNRRAWDELGMVRDPARLPGLGRLGWQMHRAIVVVHYMPGLVERICSATDLRKVSCVGYGIDNTGALQIASNLRSLVALHLWNNCIGDDGATAIAENLSQLRSLNLGGNAVGPRGVVAIAQRLRELTSLSLWCNSAGVEGAGAIAENLASLVSLQLASNKLGADGAQALASSSALLFRQV